MSHFSFLQRFLIWCVACDIELLKSCDQTLHIKYRILGGLVLTPAILACISGGYFVYTIFNSYNIALVFGLLWAMIILNFDRYLIITLKKTSSPIKDLFSVSVMLRMILAGFISYVIAQPLVLALFSPNIERLVFLEQEVEFQKSKAAFDLKSSELSSDIERLNTNSINLQSPSPNTVTMTDMENKLSGQLEQARKDLNNAQLGLSDEVAGKNGKPGEGPIYRALKVRVDTLQASITSLDGQLKTEREKTQTLRTNQLNSNHTALDTNLKNTNELIAIKNKELESLTTDKNTHLSKLNEHSHMDFLTLENKLDQLKKTNPNVKFWERLLTLLLFAIDLFALLLKVLGDPDDYDAKKKRIVLFADNALAISIKAFETTEPIRLENARQLMEYVVKMEGLDQLCNFEVQKLDLLQLRVIDLCEKKQTFEKTISKQYNRRLIDDSLFSEIILSYNHINEMATKKLFDILKSA